MPLYEYKCHSCGKTFEVIQKFADEPLKTHSECGGEVERLISAPAFHLKGSGWYATDYGKGNAGVKPRSDDSGDSKKSKEESKDSGDSKSESTAKSDSGASSESKPASQDAKPAAPAATESK